MGPTAKDAGELRRKNEKIVAEELIVLGVT